MRRRYVAIGLTVVNVLFLAIAVAWPSGGDERVATEDPTPTPEDADPTPVPAPDAEVLGDSATPTPTPTHAHMNS